MGEFGARRRRTPVGQPPCGLCRPEVIASPTWLAPHVSNPWFNSGWSGRCPHVPSDGEARAPTTCLSASTPAAEVRWGKGKYFIDSSNSFNFSAPSHQDFLSEAAGVKFFVGGLHPFHFSIPAPTCIFSPIVRATFSTFQRGFPAQFSKQP